MNIRVILLSLLYGFAVLSFAIYAKKPSHEILICYLLVALAPLLFLYLHDENFARVSLFFSTLALTLGYSLTGDFMNGVGDIYSEWFYGMLSVLRGFWEPGYSFNSINFVFPTIFLMPTISIVSGLNLNLVLKIIPNFIFALIPVLVFEIYKKYASTDLAFFSSFFFLSIPATWYMMPSVPRQEVAIFLYVLIIYLLTKMKYANTKIIALIILFSFSVVTAHYTTAMIYIIIGSPLIALSTIKKTKFNMYFNSVITFLIIFWVAWYSIINYTYPFEGAIQIFRKIIDFDNLFEESGTTYALKYGAAEYSWVVSIYLFALSCLFALVGFFYLIHKKYNLNVILISLIAFLIPTLGYVGGVSLLRVAQTTLIFWAFVFTLGFKWLFEKLRFKNNYRTLLAIFLAFSVLVHTHTISYLIFQSADNPAITHKTKAQTWVNCDDYYAITFTSLFGSSNIKAISKDGYAVAISRLSKFKNDTTNITDSYFFVNRQVIEQNRLITSKWTPAGKIIIEKEFFISNELKELIDQTKVYDSKSWIFKEN